MTRVRLLKSAGITVLLTAAGWLAGALVGLTTTDWHSSAEWFWRDVHISTAGGLLTGLFAGYAFLTRDG